MQRLTVAFSIVFAAVCSPRVVGQLRLEEPSKDVLPDHNAESVAVVVGDLDGDGSPDLVLVGARPALAQGKAGGSLSFRNGGDGTFTNVTAAWGPPPTLASDVAVADLDGDGSLDVVTAGSPSVLLANSGVGVLTSVSTRLGPPVFANAVAAFDAEGDGDVDLVFDRGFFRQGEAGLFVRDVAALDPAPVGAADLVVGDLDGDADPDIVAATSTGGRSYFNDGAGRFTPVVLPALQSSGRLALADVDGDGDLDLVVASTQNRVLRNDGAGGFTDSGALPVESAPTLSVAVGDIDADGDVDLLFTNAASPDDLYWNDGQGAFVLAAPGTWPDSELRFSDAELVDLDADGDLDAVLVQPGRNRIYVNVGGGFQATAGDMFADEGVGSGPTLVDVDNDGDLDLAQTAPLRVQRNERGTEFGPRVTFPCTCEGGEIVAADVDGDGDQDLIDPRSLLRNQGDGTFVAEAIPVGAGRSTIAVGDVDADGDVDLVHGRPGSVSLNDGTGTFSLIWSASYYTEAVALADVDGDDDLDILLITNSTPPTEGLHTLLNDGTGHFSPHAQFQQGGMSRLSVDDVDEDGDIDAWTNGPRLFLNDGTGVFAQDFTRPVATSPTNFGAFPVDLDDDGDRDLVLVDYQQSWRLWENVGQGYYQDVSGAAWQGPRLSFGTPLVGDIDGDGDTDVLAVHHDDPWHEVFVNDAQQLSAPTMARLGSDYRVVIHARAGQAAALLLNLQPLPAPIPTPWGLQQLDLATSFASPILAMSGDDLVLDLFLPTALLPLAGLDLHSQAVVARAGVGVRFTNMIADRIFL